ncbi:MAG: aldo/keto reductase [Halobacteriota archaeon]
MEYVSTAGTDVPALGLGTYRLRESACTRAVETALSLGYRQIDTAEFYGNQSAIGTAITNSPVDRSEVFVTTKVWPDHLRYDDVLRVAEEGLSKLGTEYLDLLLVHWPNDSVPIAETMGAMNQLQTDGRVRNVGVSNFSVPQLEAAIRASETPIVTNQVPYHPYNLQQSLLEFCLDADVVLTAYSPLAKGRVTRDDTLAAIGDKYGKSAAQVSLRWLVQQDNVAAIPKASSRRHLEANIDVFDFELTADEMRQIFDLEGGLLDRLRSKLGL